MLQTSELWKNGLKIHLVQLLLDEPWYPIIFHDITNKTGENSVPD